MEKFEVRMMSFDELPEEIDRDGLPDNGFGKEYSTYILIYHQGKLVEYHSDAMEPEDRCFYRDLSWIPDALETAYEFGQQDGNHEALVEEYRRETKS